MARRVDVALTKPQLWAYNAFRSRDERPVTVTMPWGRGLGKSWFERFAGVHLSVAENFNKVRVSALKPFSGVRIIGLCPTLKQFRDIHYASLEQELAGDWKPFGGKINKSTLRIEWPDGSWFQPMPAQVASSKAARGQRCDVILLDECDDIPAEVFDSVVRPWFTEPWSLRKILAGGTPRMGRQGLLWRLHSLGLSDDPKHDRYLSKHATYRDAPELVNLEEVEDARENTEPGAFAREWECDFDSASGLVYAGFDEAFHILEPPTSVHFHRYALGIDHGTEHPGAMVLIGITGYGDNAAAWVLDEDVASHRDNPEWDAIAENKYSRIVQRAWADPSRPDRINDYRRAKLNCHGADNSVQAGIGRVAGLLMKRGLDTGDDRATAFSRLYVHPRCVHTIAGFRKYKRKPDPTQPGKFLDDVLKIDDDEMDALRYAIVGEFGLLRSRKTTTPDA